MILFIWVFFLLLSSFRGKIIILDDDSTIIVIILHGYEEGKKSDVQKMTRKIYKFIL